MDNEPVIYIYKGETTELTWRRKTSTAVSDIAFTVKYDMTDKVEDALLVVSQTYGCVTVLGEPYTGLPSDAIITLDDNFIYCTLNTSLTNLLSNPFGIAKYDVVLITDTFEHIRQSYGNCNLIYSGA